LRFLDVLNNDDIARAMAAGISNLNPQNMDHMTSPTQQESIGRWRLHEDPEVFQAEDEGYLNAMRTFDYL
jgi:hypothetical protein